MLLKIYSYQTALYAMQLLYACSMNARVDMWNANTNTNTNANACWEIQFVCCAFSVTFFPFSANALFCFCRRLTT